MDDFIFQVTQKDIDAANADRNRALFGDWVAPRAQRCPLARALKRTFPDKVVTVLSDSIYVSPNKFGGADIYSTTEAMREFIEDWDFDMDTSPKEFVFNGRNWEFTQ